MLDIRQALPARLQDRPWVGPAATAVFTATATAVAFAYVALVDPNEPGHYPTCPFHSLTGLWCPGCGSLRAVHALATGDVPAALGMNALTVLVLPVLAVMWLRATSRSISGRPPRRAIPAVVIWAFAALVLVFWVARNLPVGVFLAP